MLSRAMLPIWPVAEGFSQCANSLNISLNRWWTTLKPCRSVRFAMIARSWRLNCAWPRRTLARSLDVRAVLPNPCAACCAPLARNRVSTPRLKLMSDHPSPTPEDTLPNGRRSQNQEPAPAEAASQEWVTIGQIVALFGLRGELKVIPQTDIPDRFSQLRAVYLGPEHRRYRVLKASPYKADMVLLRLAGIETPNAAEALIGLTITVPLAQIASLRPDQYYIHDLIG